MCGLDPTTRRERPIIQHKLYVYIKVGSILEGTPRTRTQSLELHPESVQRYRRRRRRHRDRILFYYTGELMPRSYYTYVRVCVCVYIYISHMYGVRPVGYLFRIANNRYEFFLKKKVMYFTYYNSV